MKETPPTSDEPTPGRPATQSPAATGKAVELCKLTDMAENTAKRFDIGDHRLSLIRLEDEVFVIGDKCTHADFSLSEGELDTDERTIECTKHGALFSIETGEPESLPALRAVPTYTATVEHGVVRVVLT